PPQCGRGHEVAAVGARPRRVVAPGEHRPEWPVRSSHGWAAGPEDGPRPRWGEERRLDAPPRLRPLPHRPPPRGTRGVPALRAPSRARRLRGDLALPGHDRSPSWPEGHRAQASVSGRTLVPGEDPPQPATELRNLATTGVLVRPAGGSQGGSLRPANHAAAHQG